MAFHFCVWIRIRGPCMSTMLWNFHSYREGSGGFGLGLGLTRRITSAEIKMAEISAITLCISHWSVNPDSLRL